MALDAAYFAYIALISATGSLLFGLDIGYLATIYTNGHFKEWIGLENPHDPAVLVPSGMQSIVTGAFSWGAIIASSPLIAPTFLDNQGRKGTMFAGGILFFFGAAMQCAAVGTIHMITAGRFVAGLSIGLLSASIPLYQSEVAPAAWRGKLTSVYQLNITIGIAIAQVLNFTILPMGVWGWRYVIAAQLIPCAFMLFALPTLPYSPTWLIKQGRYDEAKQTLIKLRGEEAASGEFELLRKIDERDKAIGEPSWGDALSNPRIRSLAVVGGCAQLFQQLCGMNVFMYYGPQIFQSMALNPAIMQFLLSVTNVAATFIGIMTIDALGRRSLFMIGGICMCMCCFVAGVGAHYEYNMIHCACIFLFVVFFASTWGPTAWVYTAEIYPSKYRSRLVGVSTSCNWVGNAVVGMVAPLLLNSIETKTYFVLCATNILNFAYGWWVPETKGVDLQSVPALWDGKLPADPDQLSDARKTT